MNPSDLLALLPLIFLNAWACVLLLVDLFIPRERKGITAVLAAAGLLGALGLTLWQAFQPALRQPEAGLFLRAFNGMVMVDGFAIFLNVLFTVSGLVGVALAYDYLRRMGLNRGEYYPLLLFTVGGMMLMAAAADLIVVFLALELLSIPLYVLSGFARPRPESEEAAMKYFLLGAFATGFVVYGVALVFGATGTTSLAGIVEAVNSQSAQPALLLIGAGLLLIGLGFKVAAVPFHMWTPDVYHGAPTSIVGFMAVGAKAGGFAALLRVFVLAFPALAVDMAPVFWGLAALTMILGNLLAIAQSNIKRLLAYSSIAHAGYILMALVPFGQENVARAGVASALFYLVAYAFTNFAAWAVVIALEKQDGKGLQLDDYAGLGRKYPLLAMAMTVAMLSFTGVPPTLGFVGKFYLFRTVIEAGYVGLALIGVLTSLISAYYYLRVVVIMYMREGDPVARSESWLNLTAGAFAVGTLLLIIFAGPLFDWAARAILRLS
jgi:NADH-quinone oxidoreductase subunit N